MSTIPTQAASSIEFNCTSCQRTLKVAASAAGKRAACPQCGAIVQVPAASAPSPAASGGMAPSNHSPPALGPSLSPGQPMNSTGSGIQFTGASAPLAPLPPSYAQPSAPSFSQPSSYAPQPQTFAQPQSYAPQPGYSP